METQKIGRVYRESLSNAIKDGVEASKSTFLFSYSAISSSQMVTLRKDLKKIGARVYVSKNRMAKMALKEIEQEDLANIVSGQTAFIWSNEDSVTIAKALVKFAKGNEGVEIKGGLLDGAGLSEAVIKRLSELPSKEVLQAQLLQMILSPLTRFASLLNAKSIDLLSILKQLSEKKSEGGNS